MSKTKEVIYEPHPVSPERKAELRAAGYQILDARFKPASTGPEPAPAPAPAPATATEPEPEPEPEADKPKRGRPAKTEPAPEAE